MGDPALTKTRPVCPRPEKSAFKTAASVRRFLRRHELIDVQEPYRCGCGMWHTTTKIDEGQA
jgi:hypothetical protein